MAILLMTRVSQYHTYSVMRNVNVNELLMLQQ